MATLRIISCGSMTVAPEFVDATRDAFGATVKRTYGSTEAPTVTTSAWDDPPDRARDTDGRVVSEAELRVVDPATGRVAGPGVAGELELRGPELFAGYAEPAQTRAAMHGSWFRTGDLATVDGDGWLTIVGRTRDIIIRGGENVVPAEVERVLEAHPAVRQAVVVGYPDDLLGERVGACVVADGSRSAWRSAGPGVPARGIARFKTPERVRRFDRFPTLSLGKPDRNGPRAGLVRRRPRTGQDAGLSGRSGSRVPAARRRPPSPRPSPARPWPWPGPGPRGRAMPAASVSKVALRSCLDSPSDRVGPAASRAARSDASCCQLGGVGRRSGRPVRGRPPRPPGTLAQHDHRLGPGQSHQTGRR